MGVPEHIVDLKLEDWYSSLSDADRMKLSRYLDKAESSSNYAFFSSIIDCALSDENPKFAVFMCLQIYDICDMDDYQRFLINEKLIDAYIGAKKTGCPRIGVCLPSFGITAGASLFAMKSSA